MKKLLTAVALFAAMLSQSAMANYCDGRDNPDQCYHDVMQSWTNKLGNQLRILYQTPKLTMQQKQDLHAGEAQWEHAVDTQCKTMACVDSSMYQRTTILSNALISLKLKEY